jgi:pyridoxamine 5'-phosphate oxidase
MLIRSTLRALFLVRKGVIGGLSEASAGADPIALFGLWFENASRSGLLLPEAMTLSTATLEGRPSSRLVLMKSFGDDGFVFFTNYQSRKAQDLEANPQAALTFHWPVLHRQVRIEGRVTRTSNHESEAYFRTRDRGSQLGAWASVQTAEIEDREALEASMAARRNEFDGREVPLPPFWGGYRLHAERIEFWQGRSNRLHDRLEYVRDGRVWKLRRLSP